MDRYAYNNEWMGGGYSYCLKLHGVAASRSFCTITRVSVPHVYLKFALDFVRYWYMQKNGLNISDADVARCVELAQTQQIESLPVNSQRGCLGWAFPIILDHPPTPHTCQIFITRSRV